MKETRLSVVYPPDMTFRDVGSGQTMPNQGDLAAIAKRLTLSPVMIRMALGGHEVGHLIPPGLRERVLVIANEIEPCSIGTSFFPLSNSSYTMGIVIPEVADGYLTAVLNGVEKELFQAGYLHTVVCHHGQEDLLTAYAASLVNGGVDGLIFINSMLPTPQNVPSVALSNHQSAAWTTTIQIDHDLAAELALKHLLDLGHHRIAFIRGQKESLDAESRWASLLYVAKTLDLDIHEEMCLQLEENEWSPHLGYPVIRDLLARKADFTAICCFNDFAAMGAIRALREAGLSCPEDVSVIGFDDIQGAEYCEPALTTIRQPLKRMGSLAARVLLDKINYPEAKFPKSILIQPSLIIRSSTAGVSSIRRRGKTNLQRPRRAN